MVPFTSDLFGTPSLLYKSLGALGIRWVIALIATTVPLPSPLPLCHSLRHSSPLCFCHCAFAIAIATVTVPLPLPLCHHHCAIAITTVLPRLFIAIATVLLPLPLCYCHHHCAITVPSPSLPSRYYSRVGSHSHRHHGCHHSTTWYHQLRLSELRGES